MYSSDSLSVQFRICKAMISDVVDMFASDVRFLNETDTHIEVRAWVNEVAMKQFAKNFGPDVEILSPAWLREDMKEIYRAALAVYE